MTSVAVDGVIVEVTPIDELTSVQAFTASIATQRYIRAQERGDSETAADAAFDLLAYCTEGVQPDTVRGLSLDAIETLFDAVLPDVSEVDHRP